MLSVAMDLKTYLSEHSITQAAFAKRLHVTQGAVSAWVGGRVPPIRVLQIEQATGGAVMRHELRPDLYPVESTAVAVA